MRNHRRFSFWVASLLFLHGCWVSDIPPVVDFVVEPPLGDEQTVFLVNASSIAAWKAPEWQVKVRWDFNSDGQWETGFSHIKQNAWKYPSKGTYRITCEAEDPSGNRAMDVQEVLVTDPVRDSFLIDNRDGQTYRTVFLYSKWWMAESLRFGQELDTSRSNADNGVPEFYINPDLHDRPAGGYYTWFEATGYGRDTSRGICPEGWHLPRMEDFACLTELSVARHFTANHFGIGGYFHLNFEGAGLYHIPSNTWHSGGGMSEYWLTVPRVAREFVSWIHFRPGNPPRVLYERDFLPPQIIGWNNDWGQFEFRRTAIAVRCVKDE